MQYLSDDQKYIYTVSYTPMCAFTLDDADFDRVPNESSDYSEKVLIVGTISPLNLNAWAYVISVSQFPGGMPNDVSLFTR